MNTRINYIIDLSINKSDMKINRELNISINKIEYKTLGFYTQNQDDVCFFYPTVNNNESWIKFYNESEPVVVLMHIGYEYFQYLLNKDNSNLEFIIDKNLGLFQTFYSKYFIEESCSLKYEIFEDFTFGRFSEYGDCKLLVDSQFENGILEYECSLDKVEIKVVSTNQETSIQSQVFINSLNSDDFMFDLNGIVELIVSSITYFKN
jgi:hypothetical protein